MRVVTRSIAVALLLIAAGCARRTGASNTVQTRETTLQVQNQTFVDMVVYVMDVDGSRRQRLDMVGATSSRQMRIPASIVGPGRALRFQVDPVGSAHVATSFEIHVTPGQVVQLTIPPSAGP